MSNTYQQFPLTNFPDSNDTLWNLNDISKSTYDAYKEYQTYIASGDFTSANNLLIDNTELQKTIINADKINTLNQQILALQNYTKDSKLEFTPVQQGGGLNQNTTNKIYIGWTGNSLDVQVDNLNLGSILYSGTGKTPLLPVERGGTGKTTGQDAANYFINSLPEGSSAPTDTDFFISQYVKGMDTNKTYLRRPISSLWEYIKSKADNIYARGETWTQVFKGIIYGLTSISPTITFTLPKYPNDGSMGNGTSNDNSAIASSAYDECMLIKIAGAYSVNENDISIPFVVEGLLYNGTAIYYTGDTNNMNKVSTTCNMMLPTDDPNWGEVMKGSYISATLNRDSTEVMLTMSSSNVNIFSVLVL